jgi:hypothetical protein
VTTVGVFVNEPVEGFCARSTRPAFKPCNCTARRRHSTPRRSIVRS